MDMRRRDFLSAGLALNGLALVGGAFVLADAAASAEIIDTRHLIANISPEPSAVAVIGSLPDCVVAANISDGLITYDEAFKPIPQLAKSWDIASDGLTVTFHLRDDVKWHDGHPFTSEDVQYSITEILLKNNPLGKAAYGALTAVETPDAHTVVLRFKNPAQVIWSYMDGQSLRIVQKRLYEGSNPLTNPLNGAPVGNGPYRFVEWVRGSHITLERNPDYWDKGRPTLDKITFKIIPDAAAREAALETGEILYAAASAVSLTAAARIRNTSKDLIVDTRGWESLVKVFFFDFNLKRPQFQDVRVRRAFAHALNRDALSKIVFQGFARPSHGPIPQTQPSYDPSIPDYKFDPKRAEALLDEAGFPRGADGVRLRINHVNHSFGDEYKLAGDLFKQQLKAIGVEVQLINYDTPTQLVKLFAERDFDTMSCDYAPFSDPQIGVLRRFWSKAIQKGVPWSNATQYSNPATDAVIEAIIVEGNPDRRRELINRLQFIAQDELPSISLVAINIFRIYSKRLDGINLTPVGSASSLEDITIKA